MRSGHNPNLAASGEAMPSMVAAVITHLPNMQGYHEHRMEIVRICLSSLRANAGIDLPVLVWDNGSCEALIDWIVDVYRPDYLVTGPNVGKASARASILRMFPPGTAIAFGDDDILYYPDWLEPQVMLLKDFPNVGAVSGWPVRTPQRQDLSATEAWASREAVVEIGKFIPTHELLDFASSIGIVGKSASQFLTAMSRENDIRVTYNGMQAYAQSQHCQFVCINDRLIPLATWERAAMVREKPFDAAINAAGLLRLTTCKRYTRHMGNVLEESLRVEIARMPA